MIDSAGPTSHSRRRTVLTLTLLALALAALIVRMAAIAEPLGIDQSLWASAVRGMSRGQLLYRDVWEQRPPGIYWVYLAAFQVFGWTSATVAWLDLLAAAATTLLLYEIARALSSRLTAAVAAALYATMTMPAWLYGHGGFLERAVSETFIVVCVCASAWCAVRWRVHRSSALAAGAGLFAGALLIFKPNAGLYFPAVLLWAFLYTRDRVATHRPYALRDAVIATAAGGVLPATALLWLWRLDLLEHARTAVVDFNRYYVGEGFRLGEYALVFSKAVWLRMKTEPLWLAGAVGAVAAVWTLLRTHRLPPLAGLAVIWGAAAVCVIVVNGARLFNSYFIQALPPLALLGAWALADALRGTTLRRAIGVVTIALMAGLLVQRDYAGRVFGTAKADLDVLTGRMDRLTHLALFDPNYNRPRGFSARANAELADYLRAHTAPEDRIFVFGINGAGVYFDADRLSAHRFLRVNFFVETEFPDPAFRLDAVLRELEAARPRYIVFERLHVSSDPEMARAVDSLPQHPEVAKLLERYVLETRIEDFSVYRRVD